MTLLCLEGPSAVGKTSTARELERVLGWAHIPEVNALFPRPDVTTDDWYADRQAERVALAQQARQQHGGAVLDGDPLQALWYAWTFPDHARNRPHALELYRRKLDTGDLCFPDRYVLLDATEPELRTRKAADVGRRRGNFERHLRLADTLPAYFRMLSDLLPGRVVTLHAASIPGNVHAIRQALAAGTSGPVDALRVFEGLTDWLARHSAPTFSPS